MKVNWRLLRRELGINEEGAEETIHELAHAHDCIGVGAFEYVGKQTEVNEMIADKYESDDSDAANMSEFKVAATTQLVMGSLGMLTEQDRRDIFENLVTNLRGAWYDRHTGHRSLFEEHLASDASRQAAIALTQFITDNYAGVTHD